VPHCGAATASAPRSPLEVAEKPFSILWAQLADAFAETILVAQERGGAPHDQATNQAPNFPETIAEFAANGEMIYREKAGKLLVFKHSAQQIDILIKGRIFAPQLLDFFNRMNNRCMVATTKFPPNFRQRPRRQLF
jgi:hypothetical protein